MRVNLYNPHFLLFSISSILHLSNQTHMRENKIFYIILLFYHFLIFYLSTFLSFRLNGPLMKLIFSSVMPFGGVDNGDAIQRSGCSRNTLQPHQEHPQNFCLHKSSDTNHNFNPCLLQPPVDDQWAMSLTVLVSLLRTLISFCHLLVEDLKSIYLFGKSSFHFLA